MSNSWFRLYSEVLNDPKVQKLPGELFKTWINILCIACDNNGTLPETLDDVSFALRMPLSETKAAFHELEKVGLIETVDETFHIKNWNKRQYKSDVSTDRVKRHRKQKRNVSVTPPEQIQNRYRTDTEQIQNRTDNKKEVYTSDFEIIWEISPRKDGSKSKAFESYQAAIKSGVEHGRIESGFRSYADYVGRNGTEKRYVAHAATWLNQRRWESDYTQPNGSSTAIASIQQTKSDRARAAVERAIAKNASIMQ